MEKEIKFLHTADIHLGKIPSGSSGLPVEVNDKLKQATTKAFSRICDIAINNQVDFILIAGDLYDREARSIASNHFFNQQCNILKQEGIKVYLINGNHDPSRARGELLELPSNLYIFDSEEFCSVDIIKNGDLVAQLIGRSYKGRAESRGINGIEELYKDNVWRIALLHTQLEPGNRNYLPCSQLELIERDIHYWALGHLHKPQILYCSLEKAAAFPGTPQGKDIGEKGVGGVFLIKLTPHLKPEINFIPTSPLIYLELEISINDNGGEINNMSELEKKIISYLEEFIYKEKRLRDIFPEIKLFKGAGTISEKENNRDKIEGYLVQLVLTGQGPVSNDLKEQGEEALEYLLYSINRLYSDKQPFVWLNRIIDRTSRPFYNLDDIMKHPLILEISKYKNKIVKDTKLQRELLDQLGYIWIEENEQEDYDPGRFQLGEELLEAIIDQAQQSIIEELIKRRGEL